MKKTIAIIVAVCMILSGTAAFAEGKSQGEASGATPVKSQEAKMLSGKLGPLVDEVKENKDEMLRLREEIRIAYADAKDAIGEMIRKRDELKLDQVQELRSSMERLRESRRILSGTVGEISGEMSRLRTRLQARNEDGAGDSLENCIRVQAMRIQELRRVLEELNKINEM